MTTPERLTLSGNTYITYDFDIFPLSGGFHPVAAVYVVTRRTGGTGADRHEVLYVGETGHLAEHFRDHPKAECFARHRADGVGVHRQDDPRGHGRRSATWSPNSSRRATTRADRRGSITAADRPSPAERPVRPALEDH